MRYDLFNECITTTREVGAGLRFDQDPLNIRENTADFTTPSEILHSETHDVQQRVTFIISEELYSLV
jgi:hypothetical protein